MNKYISYTVTYKKFIYFCENINKNNVFFYISYESFSLRGEYGSQKEVTRKIFIFKSDEGNEKCNKDASVL
jgi:hypothetical protein